MTTTLAFLIGIGAGTVGGVFIAFSTFVKKAVSEELRCQIAELKCARAGFVFDNLFHGDGSLYVSRVIPVQ